MSTDAEEFLKDNDYYEQLNTCQDICNIMEEYLAYKIGKMIFDGRLKRYKNEES